MDLLVIERVVLVAIATLLLLTAPLVWRRRHRRRLGGIVEAGPEAFSEAEIRREGLLFRLWLDLTTSGRRYVDRVAARSYRPRTTWELEVVRAGLPDLLPSQFFKQRLLLAVILTLAFVVLNRLTGAGGPLAPLLAVLFALAGYYYPVVRLRRLQEQRRKKVLADAPAFFQNLAMLLAGGSHSLEMALVVLSNEYDSPIYQEGRRVAHLRSVGSNVSLADAFEEMAQRLDVPEVTATLRDLVRQAEKGVRLSENLSRRADLLQYQINARIEKKIGQNITKIYVLMVLCALPTLMCFAMSPVLYSLLKQLGIAQ